MAHDSQGSIFSVEDGTNSSPLVYVPVDGVTNVRDLRSGSGAEIDITDLSSTAKEFSLGLKDEGSMTLDVIVNRDDAGQSRIIALRNSRLTGLFKITVPTSPNYVITFSGIVTQFPFTLAVDDVIRGSITIRVTGTIVEA
jgi:hypothetical protein